MTETNEANKGIELVQGLNSREFIQDNGNIIRILYFPESAFDYVNFERDLQFGPDRDQPYTDFSDEDIHDMWIAYNKTLEQEG